MISAHDIAIIDPDVDLTSQSGLRIRITQATGWDKNELRAFFDHLTPDDLRHRFPEALKEVTDVQIAAMVDGEGVITFLARDVDSGQLAAVATLAEQAGGQEAEVVLSTAPEWKQRGISWTLLDYVLSYARAHGLTRVSSLASIDNQDAVRLEREMGFVTRLRSAEPVELLVTKRL